MATLVVVIGPLPKRCSTISARQSRSRSRPRGPTRSNKTCTGGAPTVSIPHIASKFGTSRARPSESHKYSSKKEQDAHLSFLLNWVEEYYSRDGDMSLAAHRKVFDLYTGPKQWLSELPGPEFDLNEG